MKNRFGNLVVLQPAQTPQRRCPKFRRNLRCQERPELIDITVLPIGVAPQEQYSGNSDFGLDFISSSHQPRRAKQSFYAAEESIAFVFIRPLLKSITAA